MLLYGGWCGVAEEAVGPAKLPAHLCNLGLQYGCSTVRTEAASLCQEAMRKGGAGALQIEGRDGVENVGVGFQHVNP